MEKPIPNSKVVRKILRPLLERFRPEVTVIEDIDSIRIDELVGYIRIYEITLHNSQKPKDFAFKALENEEKKKTKMPYNMTRDEFAHMTKKIKKVMKFNIKFYKNQEFGKGKRFEQSSKENIKGSSKSKKIECFNYGGYDILLLIVLVPKILKSLYRLHRVTQILKKVVPQLLKMQGMIRMPFKLLLPLWNLSMIMIVMMNSLMIKKTTFLNNLVVEHEKLIKNYLRDHDIF